MSKGPLVRLEAVLSADIDMNYTTDKKTSLEKAIQKSCSGGKPRPMTQKTNNHKMSKTLPR